MHGVKEESLITPQWFVGPLMFVHIQGLATQTWSAQRIIRVQMQRSRAAQSTASQACPVTLDTSINAAAVMVSHAPLTYKTALSMVRPPKSFAAGNLVELLVQR
jgi:hypothetical protein